MLSLANKLDNKEEKVRRLEIVGILQYGESMVYLLPGPAILILF